MSVEYTRVKLTIINTVDNVVYNCPSSVTGIITSATATNLGTERKVTANKVFNGGLVEDANVILDAEPVLGTVYLDTLIGEVFTFGDYISMRLDDVGSVNIFLSIQEQN